MYSNVIVTDLKCMPREAFPPLTTEGIKGEPLLRPVYNVN